MITPPEYNSWINLFQTWYETEVHLIPWKLKTRGVIWDGWEMSAPSDIQFVPSIFRRISIFIFKYTLLDIQQITLDSKIEFIRRFRLLILYSTSFHRCLIWAMWPVWQIVPFTNCWPIRETRDQVGIVGSIDFCVTPDIWSKMLPICCICIQYETFWNLG